MGNHTPYIQNPNYFNGNTPGNWFTGKDYWKYQQLDVANAMYAKAMKGKKYEDDPRAR